MAKKNFLTLLLILGAWSAAYAVSPAGPAAIGIQFPAQLAPAAGGSPNLTFAYQTGKQQQGSGTTLSFTPAVKPSTNSLVIVVAFCGQSTFTSIVSNQGNNWVQDIFENRVTNQAIAVWHHVATNTYNGVYSATVTVGGVTSITGGLIIASNTQTTAGVDVATTSYRLSWQSVAMGTTTATNANTGIFVCGMTDNTPSNETIIINPASRYTDAGSEENGGGFATGSTVYSTTSVSGLVAFNGSFNLAATREAATACVAFKAPSP